MAFHSGYSMPFASRWFRCGYSVQYFLTMSQLTVQLPDAVVSELAQAGRASHRTPEAVAAEMIQRMIAVQRIDRLRADVRQALGDADPVTEGKILDEIS
jgi:predicted transcriptional regulator